MMRNHKQSKRRQQAIPLWTYTKAQEAVLYVDAIMRSLRDHRLQAQFHHLRAERLANLSGRPDRQALIAHQEALREVAHAEACYSEALAELQALGVYCQDPLRGLGLMPFVHKHLLAWFVYDLFGSAPLESWRYHTDPLEKRRSLVELVEPAAEHDAGAARPSLDRKRS